MKPSNSNLTRRFKVAAVSQQANSFGLHGHMLIAANGEAWEVGRSRGRWHADQPFNQGDVVRVPLVPTSTSDDAPIALNWARLSCEIPRRLPDAPQAVVDEFWGAQCRSTK
jgi:hypothetical protein